VAAQGTEDMKTLFACVFLACSSAACGGDAGDPPSEEGPVPPFDPTRTDHEHDTDVQLDDDFKGCPEGIPVFEPGLEASGEHFTLKLIAAVPSEPERYRNDWTVEVRAVDGAPAPDAEITRGQTFMPVHGHDGRVKPKMKALSEPGQFEVDGLNFTMRGPWEVRLWLRSPSVDEELEVFHVCVAK
jgi:hypothetical protein